MQIVIDISEVAYLDANHHSASLWSFLTETEIQRAIRNGIVLPEKHGRLVDADAMTKDVDTFFRMFTRIIGEEGQSAIVCNALTVIEATED